jgi:hypothetical protein
MAKNAFGLDDRYFSEKLGQIARDAHCFTPAEMTRALESLADVARFQASAAANQQATTHQHSEARA